MRWNRILLTALLAYPMAESAAVAQNFKQNFGQPPLPVVPGQPYVPAGPPLVLPAVFPKNSGDLENFLENVLEKHFGKAVHDIDVDVHHHNCIDVEVDTPHHYIFVQVHQLVCSMPQLAGYKISVIHRNLDDCIENKIKKLLGHCVDDVDVDVHHGKKCIDIEVELRFPGAYYQLQQVLATMPELAGYQVRLKVEYDD